MEESFVTFVLGIFICVLGTLNMKGNISSIHRYHRHRVSEENIKPFGKLVGLGTLIIGAALILFSLLSLFSEQTGSELPKLIGSIVMGVSFAAGLGISFFAMFKYNKGIF